GLLRQPARDLDHGQHRAAPRVRVLVRPSWGERLRQGDLRVPEQPYPANHDHLSVSFMPSNVRGRATRVVPALFFGRRDLPRVLMVGAGAASRTSRSRRSGDRVPAGPVFQVCLALLLLLRIAAWAGTEGRVVLDSRLLEVRPAPEEDRVDAKGDPIGSGRPVKGE